MDRGFRPQLLPARGADRGAAPGREGGLREAHPHDVARGEQLGGRGQLAAQLLPGLRPRCCPRSSARDLEAALRVVIARTEQLGGLHARLRRGGAPAPARSRAPATCGSCWPGSRVLLRAECERRERDAGAGTSSGAAAAVDARPRPDGAGVRQRGQERAGGDRRRRARSPSAWAAAARAPSSPSRTPAPACRPRPGPPVHPVLHHQGERPGHRADAGAARSSTSTASTTRWNARPAGPPSSRSCFDDPGADEPPLAAAAPPGRRRLLRPRLRRPAAGPALPAPAADRRFRQPRRRSPFRRGPPLARAGREHLLPAAALHLYPPERQTQPRRNGPGRARPCGLPEDAGHPDQRLQRLHRHRRHPAAAGRATGGWACAGSTARWRRRRNVGCASSWC